MKHVKISDVTMKTSDLRELLPLRSTLSTLKLWLNRSIIIRAAQVMAYCAKSLAMLLKVPIPSDIHLSMSVYIEGMECPVAEA